MKKGQPRTAVHRKDYTPYAWELQHVRLHFAIHDEYTEVNAELSLLARDDGGDQALELIGEGLDTLGLWVNDEAQDVGQSIGEEGRLRIAAAPSECVLRTRVRIHPASNAALEGLYVSGDFILTQCEQEGFRRRTWFPDRPDVMSR
jgi:aminopeptidase N